MLANVARSTARGVEARPPFAPGTGRGDRSDHEAVPRPAAARPRPRRAEERPHRHRHAERLRHQMRFDLAAGLPAGHHQEAAPQVDHPRAALVPARATPTSATCRSTASPSGTSGPTRTATSARSTATSGAPGRRRTAATSTRSASVVEQIRTQPRLAPAHRQRLERGRHRRAWRCRPATPCSSSTWRTGGSPASSTSAAPTSSSACRSTSPPTRC